METSQIRSLFPYGNIPPLLPIYLIHQSSASQYCSSKCCARVIPTGRLSINFLTTLTMTDNFTSIPIIDFSLSTSSATKPIFLSELRDAILKVGFFYLKTHPIPEDVQQGLLAQTAQFFDLPPEKKEEVDIINSKHFLGYIGQEATKSKSTNDRRETYTVCILITSVSVLARSNCTFFLDWYGSTCTRR